MHVGETWSSLFPPNCPEETRTVYEYHLYGCFQKWGYPKIDGLQWKTLSKWMIWGYPYFWKHPYDYITITIVVDMSFTPSVRINLYTINVLFYPPSFWGLHSVCSKQNRFHSKCQLAKKGAAYEITISYFPKPFKQPRTYHSWNAFKKKHTLPNTRPNKKPSYKLDRLDTWFLKGCVKHHKGLLDIPKSTNQPLCFLAHDWHIRLVTNRVT